MNDDYKFLILILVLFVVSIIIVTCIFGGISLSLNWNNI
jgi:hypothetical protein